MELKEFKEKAQDKVVDIIVNLGVFELSEIMDIEDIREAKKSFDELSDLLNEYIKENDKPKFDKPKFEVGDYVVYKGNYDTYVTELQNITGKVTFDVWFSKQSSEFDIQPFIMDKSFRHATPEEIAEYEAALNFHKHGRKPFELKDGDMLFTDGYRFFVEDHGICDKEDFVSGRYTLLKTAEEIEAWLNDGQ